LTLNGRKRADERFIDLNPYFSKTRGDFAPARKSRKCLTPAGSLELFTAAAE
jgi:hypothetical protein